MIPLLELGGGEERLGGLVLEVGDLQAEEEELRLESRSLLGQPRDERAASGVGHVRRELEVGEVACARDERLDSLQLCNRLGELGGGEPGDLPVVALPEGGTCVFGLLDVSFEPWVAGSLVQVGEVPRDLLRSRDLRGRHGPDST